ncbi:jg26864 [Pararge aegeria aegeria]|uniref:Jg26864 protein n=1 Tax=Pararge aegeria aegeria TaxID=348720 RepID=A0A8S4S8Z2_9NEOP|nr:jg26864 [Pararge aegeria aegeria]
MPSEILFLLLPIIRSPDRLDHALPHRPAPRRSPTETELMPYATLFVEDNRKGSQSCLSLHYHHLFLRSSSSSSACGSGSSGPWCHVDRLRSIVTPLSRSPSKHWLPPGIAALSLLEEVKHPLVVLYTSPKECCVYASERGRNRLSAAASPQPLYRINIDLCPAALG